MITIKDIPNHILSRWCRLLFNPICKWYYKNAFFSKAALCISGLVFSHSLVGFSVIKLLEDYLSFTWSKQHLAKLTASINLQDGVSAVSAVIVAHIADSCVGRFNMILLSTLTYITGLVLLGFSTNVGIYVGLLAVALGKSGRDPVLKDFLADQMSGKKDFHKDEEIIEDRRKVWWRIAWILGAITGFFVTLFASWAVTFLVSILVMGASFWIFWIGFFYYDQHDLVQTPLHICYRVFMTAISKRHLSYPSTPNEFHGNLTGGILLSPEVRFFRWLDKAAIKSSEEEGHGMFCTVKEVSDVKRLLTMMPMWANFVAYCLIKSTRYTFFIEQSNNLKMGDGIIVLYLLQSLVSSGVQTLSEHKKVRQKCGPLVKIGAGMVFSIACCIAACLVETRRLYLIKEEGIDPDAVDPEQTISMTVYSLVPQFLLFALMESLAGDGLEEFVDDHIPDSMRRYGPLFNECALSFGYFLSIPLLLLFRSWFGDTINRSHLQRYYLFLAILSSIFFGIYLYLSPKYARMEVIPSESEDMELLELENGARDQIEFKPTKSPSSTRWKRLVNVTTATRRFYSPLATVKGMQSTTAVQFHESMEEELPLRCHYPSTEDGARGQIEFKPTKSSSSTRWKRLVNVTTATRRFYSALATVKGMQSTKVQYHESMEEELPLQSHYPSTEDGARDQSKFKPTKSSSSTRWKWLINVTTATHRFYSPLATVKGMQSTTAVQYHESMEEELPLRSHYPSTEDEELVPDDEPGSLQVSLAEAEIVPDD